LERLKKENEELKTVLKGMATVFGEEILAKARKQMMIKGDSGTVKLTPYEALIISGKKKD
jgi:hypothetical protein